MTKVLFITSTFPRSENDVVAKWIGELAVKLTKEGVDVSVFAPSFCGLSSHIYRGIKVTRFRYAPSFMEILTQEEGAVFKLKKNPFLVFLMPLFFLSGSLKLIQYLRKNRYDVIHVHWPFPMGLFGILAKRINGGKLVLTFYGAEFTLVRKIPLGKFVLRFIIKSADQVTAISTYTAELVKKIYPVSVSIIPFTSSFKPKNVFFRSIRRQNKVKTILFVGRLIERKGIKYLISAMLEVLKSVDSKLEIVGSGPLEKELVKQVIELGLTKSVFLRGRITDNELAALYKECDVFVLPSIEDKWGDSEGLGVVLLEAMSFAKPVVASKIGGITDIVKHGRTGLLVRQKDAKGLAKAIVEVLQNDKLAHTLAEGGFLFFKRHFSWKATIEKTKKLYA